MNKAIFFDKDGVLNVDKDITGTAEPVELFPVVGDLISGFRKKGFKIFVVTNQPVVARGIISEAKLIEILEAFKAEILGQNTNAFIDKIYYCPHHPNADVEEYRQDCECRKPKPGMLLKASREFMIDLGKSYMIGDRISDIIAGHLAGCKTVQLLSGMHSKKMIESSLKITEEIKPDFSILKVLELKDIIS